MEASATPRVIKRRARPGTVDSNDGNRLRADEPSKGRPRPSPEIPMTGTGRAPIGDRPSRVPCRPRHTWREQAARTWAIDGHAPRIPGPRIHAGQGTRP